MILSTFGAAALLTIVSVVIGRALETAGIRCGAAGPAVGLSVVIIAAGIAIQLPGRAVTAAVAVGLITVIAVAATVARERQMPTVAPGPSLAAIVGALGAAIPFVANGRIGLLGVSLDNDTASHLLWASELTSPVTVTRYGGARGYPMGPHSLVDTLGAALGIRADLGFTALLIASVTITAMVAAGAVRRAPVGFQVAGGALASLFYLLAAYYAEGAFKEQLLALLVLAVVVALEGVRSGWSKPGNHGWSLLCPTALLITAAIYVYSYPGVSWFALTIVIWLGVELAFSRELRPWLPRLRRALRPLGVAVLLAGGLLLPIVPQVIRFATLVGVSPAATGAIAASNLGNLPHALSPYEALGIWNSPDFRFAPAGPLAVWELAALALAVLVFGLAKSLRQRELVLLSAVAACAILYLLAAHGQSPYVAAKALVVAGPVVAVTQLRGLTGIGRGEQRPLVRWSSLVAGIAFVGVAGYSSYEVLRNEPVWPMESTNELLKLARTTRGQTVLFLGDTDYAAWLFHDSVMSTVSPTSAAAGRVFANPGKPFLFGTEPDVDSVETASLVGYQWLVTTNTSYMSQVPSSFRLVRRLRMYELWRRVGDVAPRQNLDVPGAPGVLIDCHTPSGRRFTHQHGVAGVMVRPVGVSLDPLAAGQRELASLPLHSGVWQLSLQYTSAVPLTVASGGHSWRMPAYLDRLGPVFAVGSVSTSGTGPLRVAVSAAHPSIVTGPSLGADPSYLVATNDSNQRTAMPLADTCGRYVDWYLQRNSK